MPGGCKGFMLLSFLLLLEARVVYNLPGDDMENSFSPLYYATNLAEKAEVIIEIVR
jgi:hypothetical protein